MIKAGGSLALRLYRKSEETLILYREPDETLIIIQLTPLFKLTFKK